MNAATITAEDIIRRYASDIAFVAEEPPAADVGTFIDQLYTAARRFGEAGINGREDLEDAAVFLNRARHADDETDRGVLLRQTDELLTDLWDMTQDYRAMVGG